MDAVRAARAVAREYRMNYQLTQDHIESAVFSTVAEAFDKFAEALETGRSAYDEEEPAPKGDLALQRTSVRRQVYRHIISAFADLPLGTKLTIAQIVAHTSEEYGNDHPATGAVAAWLFRTEDGHRESLTPGIVPCYVGNMKGGERIA